MNTKITAKMPVKPNFPPDASSAVGLGRRSQITRTDHLHQIILYRQAV